MKELTLTSTITVCRTDELDDDARQLIETAKAATDNSYSPYSHFKVGAALRLGDGTVIQGANQENAAFGVTLCAERTAIFAAQAQHPEQPVCELAIAAANERGLTAEPVTPCGSCRQVMLEIEQRYHRPITIYLYGTRAVYVARGVRTLLPLAFIDESMENDEL